MCMFRPNWDDDGKIVAAMVRRYDVVLSTVYPLLCNYCISFTLQTHPNQQPAKVGKGLNAMICYDNLSLSRVVDMVGVSKRQTMTNGHEPHHKSHEYLLLIAIICCINCSDVRHHEGNRDTSEPPGFSMAKSPMRRWIDPVSGCSCPRACWRRREMTSTCGMSKRLPEISGKNGKIVRECLTVDLVWICSKKGWINSFSHTFSHFWGKDKRRWVNCLGLAPSVAPGPKARSKSLGAAKERWLDMTRHWKLRQFMAVPKNACGFSGGKLLWVFWRLNVDAPRLSKVASLCSKRHSYFQTVSQWLVAFNPRNVLAIWSPE